MELILELHFKLYFLKCIQIICLFILRQEMLLYNNDIISLFCKE